jgi:hypothetical protein
MPHISLFGGPSISSGGLSGKFNISNGSPTSLGIITSNISSNGGIGMLEGPNVSSPLVWMYNSSFGYNAFTVASTNYMPGGLTTLSSGLSSIEGAFNVLFQVRENGSVGIGTTTPGSFKLAVEGKIGAREVQVTLQNPWPDYVFEPTYHLKPLAEIETYIKENKHLPEMPSAKEMEKNGVQLGEMNMLLLKKVEELTLWAIEQNKKMEKIQKENTELKARVEKIENKK